MSIQTVIYTTQRLELLKDAYQRIKDSSHWTQNVEAVDEEGKWTWADSSDAVKWCALGSLVKSIKSPLNRQGVTFGKILPLLMNQLPDGVDAVSALNDDVGHEAICALYEKTIAQGEHYLEGKS